MFITCTLCLSLPHASMFIIFLPLSPPALSSFWFFSSDRVFETGLAKKKPFQFPNMLNVTMKTFTPTLKLSFCTASSRPSLLAFWVRLVSLFSSLLRIACTAVRMSCLTLSFSSSCCSCTVARSSSNWDARSSKWSRSWACSSNVFSNLDDS